MFRDHLDVQPAVPVADYDDAPVGQSKLDDIPMHVRYGAGEDEIVSVEHDFVVDEPLCINHSRFMDASTAITIMSALAQPTRLRTFRLLVEQGEEGMASGAIAAAVGAPQNTMSSHLTILTHAKLVSRHQQGRTVTYRAMTDDVEALSAFLTS
jgi:ArsR family transcriptional regulator, arsenate/arsenite/antimonite-responsive transcriptional repressor